MKKIVTLLLICLASLMIVACEKDNSEPTITGVIAQKSNGLSSDTSNQNSLTQTNPPIIMPTQDSTAVSTEMPTITPTDLPTDEPTFSPTENPSLATTPAVTSTPIVTVKPTVVPTPIPTVTVKPTTAPTATTSTTIKPTEFPKPTATEELTQIPTISPTETPTATPTQDPTGGIDFISENLLQDIENEFVKLVNSERKMFYLPELSLNKHLDNGAQIRSQEIIFNRSHVRPDGSAYKTAVDRNSYYYMWITENLCVVPYIVENFNQTGQQIAQTLFDTFKSSPGHYQNIIFNLFRDCGFGITCAIDDNTGYLNFYFCHIMAVR